ncbi:MAG TPA: hypothetical protein VM513_18450 [Kofleriaceae bacterium]|nr:hypothetical protein [Kofleriaceae bacterium]
MNEIKADGTVEVIYQRGGTTKREVFKREVLRKKQPQKAVRFTLATVKKGL